MQLKNNLLWAAPGAVDTRPESLLSTPQTREKYQRSEKKPSHTHTPPPSSLGGLALPCLVSYSIIGVCSSLKHSGVKETASLAFLLQESSCLHPCRKIICIPCLCLLAAPCHSSSLPRQPPTSTSTASQASATSFTSLMRNVLVICCWVLKIENRK